MPSPPSLAPPRPAPLCASVPTRHCLQAQPIHAPGDHHIHRAQDEEPAEEGGEHCRAARGRRWSAKSCCCCRDARRAPLSRNPCTGGSAGVQGYTHQGVPYGGAGMVRVCVGAPGPCRGKISASEAGALSLLSHTHPVSPRPSLSFAPPLPHARHLPAGGPPGLPPALPAHALRPGPPGRPGGGRDGGGDARRVHVRCLERGPACAREEPFAAAAPTAGVSQGAVHKLDGA